ncbi:hypothetical protein MTR_6g012130 [Medicago truncatula]|uniref:Uncharacterized protein n=1 Tax=Medicago truncatula TaxID=3880 RepID=G7KKH3_MEDTR|nr:hypothetical protein MTR_6g012130 [Medicago truncatula]
MTYITEGKDLLTQNKHHAQKIKIFADSTPFQKDEVKNVQERCANLILELIEANEDSL